MNAEKENMTETIERYLLGRMPQQEREAFEERLARDTDLKQETEFQRSLISAVRHARRQELKSFIRENANKEDGQDRRKIMPVWWLAAAAVVLVAVFTFLLRTSSQDSAKSEVVAQQSAQTMQAEAPALAEDTLVYDIPFEVIPAPQQGKKAQQLAIQIPASQEIMKVEEAQVTDRLAMAEDLEENRGTPPADARMEYGTKDAEKPAPVPPAMEYENERLAKQELAQKKDLKILEKTEDTKKADFDLRADSARVRVSEVEIAAAQSRGRYANVELESKRAKRKSATAKSDGYVNAPAPVQQENKGLMLDSTAAFKVQTENYNVLYDATDKVNAAANSYSFSQSGTYNTPLNIGDSQLYWTNASNQLKLNYRLQTTPQNAVSNVAVPKTIVGDLNKTRMPVRIQFAGGKESPSYTYKNDSLTIYGTAQGSVKLMHWKGNTYLRVMETLYLISPAEERKPLTPVTDKAVLSRFGL